MDRDRLCAFFNRLQTLVDSQAKEGVARALEALRELGTINGPAEFVVVRDGVGRLILGLRRVPDAVKYQLLLCVISAHDVSAVLQILDRWVKQELRVSDSRIRGTLATIQASFHRPGGCRLARLARSAKLSPWHLSKLFHKETGRHLPEYIRRVRIEAAGRLLSSNPRLSLSHVAKKTGFKDDKDLCHNFRFVTGCSPKQYVRLTSVGVLSNQTEHLGPPVARPASAKRSGAVGDAGATSPVRAPET
jgi:AraC-like DNA-binding protein